METIKTHILFHLSFNTQKHHFVDVSLVIVMTSCVSNRQPAVPPHPALPLLSCLLPPPLTPGPLLFSFERIWKN